ncbi:MAG: glycosyltransferase family 2 protein [Bacillota bacterium]
MISIVIPVYNQAKKLRLALTSIIAQKGVEFEVIVVNDGSLDNPEKEFSDVTRGAQTEARFVFINQANQGAPAARNRGLREAQGEYLFFCDADADLSPEALFTLQAALEANPEASYAYPSFRWGNKLFKVGPFDPEKLREGPYIHTMALIRRSSLPQGGWDETIRKFQDWDLWLTMLEAGKYGIWIDKVLFNIAPGGTISSWLPSFAYKLLPFLSAVKKYKAAMAIIKQKHDLA